MGSFVRYGYTAILHDPSTPGEGSFAGFCGRTKAPFQSVTCICTTDTVESQPAIIEPPDDNPVLYYVGVFVQKADDSYSDFYDVETRTELVVKSKMPVRVPSDFMDCTLQETNNEITSNTILRQKPLRPNWYCLPESIMYIKTLGDLHFLQSLERPLGGTNREEKQIQPDPINFSHLDTPLGFRTYFYSKLIEQLGSAKLPCQLFKNPMLPCSIFCRNLKKPIHISQKPRGGIYFLMLL